ncbi:hypothetical protein [Mycobacterium dioxanotrophicus]|uniref:hypothetical protein n=1 Tax=Mycobacterium dioxanotrophicus TaxID=482462 RepID=UPI0018DFDB5F|nr:hypothetical protein [Mycobacterium dioxanotrophicus]
MTALQDWLSTSPLNPRISQRTVKALVCAQLRGVLPARRAAVREEPPRIRPGIERC